MIGMSSATSDKNQRKPARLAVSPLFHGWLNPPRVHHDPVEVLFDGPAHQLAARELLPDETCIQRLSEPLRAAVLGETGAPICWPLKQGWRVVFDFS